MQSNPIEEISEAGDAYWQQRVVTLEFLVAELLVKNQTMRFSLQALEQQKPTTCSHSMRLFQVIHPHVPTNVRGSSI